MESSHRPRHAIGSPAAFRPQAKEYALHPLEKALTIITILLLVFLPWALGGMKLWTQQIAFGLAALAFVLALIPRTYDDRYHAGGNLRLHMWPKLRRFPIFWLGPDHLHRPIMRQHPLHVRCRCRRRRDGSSHGHGCGRDLVKFQMKMKYELVIGYRLLAIGYCSNRRPPACRRWFA